MPTKFLRRATGAFAVLLIAVSLNFFLPRLMPGDPLALIAGDAVRQMSPAKKAELRAVYGLDRPLGEQFLGYLGRLAQGDLGYSYRYSGGQSVSRILANRLGWTLLLVMSSLILGTILGAALGIWAAVTRGSPADLGLLGALFTLRSIPPFWLAMLFIPLLAVELRLFPSGDSYSIPRPAGLEGAWDVLYHAILPVTILTLTYLPAPFAILRGSMLDVLYTDYVRTARAKGVRERQVKYHHALRNALLPLLAAFSLDLGQMLGGAVLIETVFNYRGIGSLMFEAVKSRDYPLLQGGFLIFTAGVLCINLLMEWIYPRFDPRLHNREW